MTIEPKSSPARLSISAKWAIRSPVLRSTMTVGESAARDSAYSPIQARFPTSTALGNIVSMWVAGEKPSKRRYGAGSKVASLRLVGMTAASYSR